MKIFLMILLSSLQQTLTASDTDQKFRALSFGRSANDYIKFTPNDMTPFVNSFTVCSWMKRLHDAEKPIVFHYSVSSDAIITGDNGFWNYINSNIDLRGKFPGFPGAGVWFHHCLSWTVKGTQRVYVDGVEIGSKPASTRNLKMGGSITIGNRNRNPKRADMTFGGELYNLNLFSKQLTLLEIKEMADAGICSAIEKSFKTREMKWEEILTKPRQGNVTEFQLKENCVVDPIENLRKKLNETEAELREVSGKLNETEKELNETKGELDETHATLREKETELKETEIALTDKTNSLKKTETDLKRTEEELDEVSTTLNGTLVDLTETKARLNKAETELENKETELEKTRTALTETTTSLYNTERKLNSTVQELDRVSTSLNDTQTVLTETRTELYETQEELKEKETKLNAAHIALRETNTILYETETKLESAERDLVDVRTTLNHTRAELEKARKLDKISRWDVLLTPPYLNKIFTSQLYTQLTAGWEMMENFIGENVTVALVEHFREEHEMNADCDDYEQSEQIV